MSLIQPSSSAQPPSPQVGLWLTWVGAAGVVLGLTGLAMVFALPRVELGWYGALLAFLGLAQTVELLRHLSSPGRLVRAALALVYIGCGAALLTAPAAAHSLAMLVAVMFGASGAFRIVWSLALPTWSKAWSAGAGVAAIAIGLLMLVGWPSSAMWVLAAAVSFDLVAYGISAILLGWTLRH